MNSGMALKIELKGDRVDHEDVGLARDKSGSSLRFGQFN